MKPDRQTILTTASESTAPVVPTALRKDGTAPRSLGERLGMLATLVGIGLAVAVPTLVVTGIFGLRPRPKAPPIVQPTPDPTGLREAVERSANSLLPTPAALTPDPITVSVRPEHLAARTEKITRLAWQFGGMATEGIANDGERHLFVDLPATASAAFRLAIITKANAASPPPAATPSATAVGEKDHIEVIIRSAGDDE